MMEYKKNPKSINQITPNFKEYIEVVYGGGIITKNAREAPGFSRGEDVNVDFFALSARLERNLEYEKVITNMNSIAQVMVPGGVGAQHLASIWESEN